MMTSKNTFEKLLITIYSYAITAFLGWQILSFVDIYFQLNQRRIKFSFQQWMEIQNIYFPVAAAILIFLIVLLLSRVSIKQKQYQINYQALKMHIVYFAALIALVLVNYVLYLYKLNQNFLELINCTLAILCLSQLSKIFYIKQKSTWFHPTTLSTFYISTILLGISQLILFKIITYPSSGYAYSLLILLVLEILRIFSRFKYLTKFSYDTNMIARSLLGKYGIYFGTRVIVGIFIPIVYIFYALYSDDKLFQAVGALLIIGEFIERLLFVYLSGKN